MMAKGLFYGGCIFAAAFSATVLVSVAVTDAPWVEAVVAAAYGRPAGKGSIASGACQDAVGVGFALGTCFGVGLLLCVDLLVYRVEARDVGAREHLADHGLWLQGLWKMSSNEGLEGGEQDKGRWWGRDGDEGHKGPITAGKAGGGIRRCRNGLRSRRRAVVGAVKTRTLSEGCAPPYMSDPDSDSEGGWRNDADPFSPSDAASLWEDTESTGDERRPGRPSGDRLADDASGGRPLDLSCSTSAITDTTDVAGTSEEWGGRGGEGQGRRSDSPWSEDGMAGKARPRDPILARVFDDDLVPTDLQGSDESPQDLAVAHRSNSDLVASVRGWGDNVPRAREWRSPARRHGNDVDEVHEVMSESGRCCVPWLPRACGGEGHPGGERQPDLTQSLESIIIGSCDGSLDVGEWSPAAPTECSRVDLPICFRSMDSLTRRTDPEECMDASPERMMMAAYLAGNQSDGGRSAPPEIHSRRSAPCSFREPCVAKKGNARKGAAGGDSHRDSEYIVQKSHKTSRRTILDELELLAEMTREECVYRIACQKEHIHRLRESDASRREAFASLKRGVAPTTKAVNRLRQRWGGKRRAKRREKLGTLQFDPLIDDTPLPVRNGCGVRADNGLLAH
eukprot:evm.model.scf_592.1 EVM.evm.TU.scf_592.1   scf_592:2298-4612(+)